MMTRLLPAVAIGLLLASSSCGKDKKSNDRQEPTPTPPTTPTTPRASDANRAPAVADAAPIRTKAIDAAVAQIDAMVVTPKVKEPKTAKPTRPTNLKLLSKKWSSERLESEMRSYTKALGVKCDHCHVGKDYASDKNAKKALARKMITMQRSMNASYFKTSKKKLSCNTCHKGNAEL